MTKSEELLEDLEEHTKKEKYFEAIKEDLEKLHKGLAHDKENDIQKNKEQIIELLEQEIVGRYHYREGRIQATFDQDPDVKKAMELIRVTEEYTALLSGTKTYIDEENDQEDEK